MKKFNQAEKNVIIEGLEMYLEVWAEQIEDILNRGKRPIFTQGYARQVINDLINKVEDLSKK